ncbi:retinol-binding protein pinta isoform X2 [Monomorium pharaonis]|uniref:retinol-binding protein pinta isoform X2 n=1 Tax=Monomorium pharaonis TaxID=307658 RepID=UPI00063F7782|nr:retinol-binding protein pinta isoform X2 [Monomorium pharaonis]
MCRHQYRKINPCLDNFLILRFLRVCKFNLEKTKVRIQNYYKQRSDLPEWYTNKNPFRPELQELLDLGILLPLRKPDSQGRLVFILRGTRHDPSIHKIPDLSKACVLAIEAAIKYYPAASVYGYVVFIDVANPTMGHIFQFQPYVLTNLIHAWQRCYPMRYQKIVIFNAPTIFDIVVKILKSFMTEKMKSRFYIYTNALHCFEDIPANILPVEYGGTDVTLQELTEYWKKNIEENRDWLTKDENDQTTQTAEPEETESQEITHL